MKAMAVAAAWRIPGRSIDLLRLTTSTFCRTSGTWRIFRCGSRSGASSREHMVWWLCSAELPTVPCPLGLGDGSTSLVGVSAAPLAPSLLPSTIRHAGTGGPAFASFAAIVAACLFMGITAS